ncbi:MAG: ribonuclease HII [Patescibacteria group bacterium]
MTKPTWREEKKLWKKGYRFIAGVDEAGRGAWAGPLVAAAVILPKNFKALGLNDSKKLTPAKREKLFSIILQHAVDWATSVISVADIDAHGVGLANRRALRNSVGNLQKRADHVLVDGFAIDYGPTPSQRIVHGDAKVMSIAAASIIAKVTRDRMMVDAHTKYPQYHFHAHKGYGTELHRQALYKYGLSPLHRRSYLPIKLIAAKSMR